MKSVENLDFKKLPGDYEEENIFCIIVDGSCALYDLEVAV